MNQFDITNFGAIGDGLTDNATAIQQAIDACSEQGGGLVYIPAGTFMTGPFNLKSNVEFHVSAMQPCWPIPTRWSTPKAPSKKTTAKAVFG
jgi:polygalacturonase